MKNSNRIKCGVCGQEFDSATLLSMHEHDKPLSFYYDQVFAEAKVVQLPPPVDAQGAKDEREARRELFDVSLRVAVLVKAKREGDPVKIMEAEDDLEAWLFQREEKLTKEQLRDSA